MKKILFFVIFLLIGCTNKLEQKEKSINIETKQLTSDGRSYRPVYKENNKILHLRCILNEMPSGYPRDGGLWDIGKIDDLYVLDLTDNSLNLLPSSLYKEYDVKSEITSTGGVFNNISYAITKNSSDGTYSIDSTSSYTDLLLVNNTNNMIIDVTTGLKNTNSFSSFQFWGWSYDSKYFLFENIIDRRLYLYSVRSKDYVKIKKPKDKPRSIMGMASWSPNENKFVYYVADLSIDGFSMPDAPFGDLYLGEVID